MVSLLPKTKNNDELARTPRTSKGEAQSPFSITRWAWLAGLLVLELAALAFLFDPTVPSGRSELLAFVVHCYPLALRTAIAAVVALLFFGWRRMRDELAATTAVSRPIGWLSLLTGAQVLTFAGFAALTTFILGPQARF